MGRLEMCAANLLPAVVGLVLLAAAWLLPAFELYKPARPLACRWVAAEGAAATATNDCEADRLCA